MIGSGLLLALGALPLVPDGDAAERGAPRPARPDVLMIIIDDAGWEDFVQAPADDIAALAGAGRVYTRCYVSPTCSPSRYQLHFGRYPHRELIGTALGAGTDDGGAATTTPSLAERLAAEGYATGLFGKWHVNTSSLPILQREAARVHGYQTWRAGTVGNLSSQDSHYDWPRIDDGTPSLETRYTTLAISEALEEWWLATDGPRFAVCSFLAPHEPFDVPPSELVPDIPTLTLLTRARYLYALEGVDNAIAKLATTLDLSNTYVFLLPDNGTPADAPPLEPLAQGYKLTPYEGGIHVPLVVWGPGVTPGIDDALVQAVDLPATILELTGAPPAPGGDSISFAPTLTGGAGSRSVAFVQRFTPNGGPFDALNIDAWSVVREDGLNLVRPDSLNPPPGGVGLELYDLSVDPWQTTPLLDPAAEAALQALRIELLGPDWPYPY